MLACSWPGSVRWHKNELLGNYLPLVYPVHLRGTGESFAANIGGRLIGTSMAAVVTYLATANFIPGVAAGR
ncbi:MAG: hypothetical protein U0894_09425 [Pirellulales bacterium]